MCNHKSLVLGYLRIVAMVCGSVMLMGAISLSALASTFHTVDYQVSNGPMLLELLGASYSAGQWTFSLSASNTGSQTLNDVNLLGQFVWDNTNQANELPLTYTTYNSWAGNGDTFAFSSVTGGTLVPFSLDRSNVDTPLTWSRTGNPATVLSTDTVPAISFGDFAPNQTDNFTLTCASNDFNPDVVGFFVAVPEPSTFALLVVGGVGTLGCMWRRKSKA